LQTPLIIGGADAGHVVGYDLLSTAPMRLLQPG